MDENTPPAQMIKKQRIFMVILGYSIIALAYSLKFVPETINMVVVAVTGTRSIFKAFCKVYK